MTVPVPFATLQAIGVQLSVISIANGYNTDIGLRIRLNDTQRDTSDRPSIAIGSNNGELDLTSETGPNGTTSKSPRARRMAIIVEAAMDAEIDAGLEVAQLMLEDIERALAIDSCIAPAGVGSAKFSTWSALDAPDGAEAVVLQLLGSAEYIRPPKSST